MSNKYRMSEDLVDISFSIFHLKILPDAKLSAMAAAWNQGHTYVIRVRLWRFNFGNEWFMFREKNNSREMHLESLGKAGRYDIISSLVIRIYWK